MPEPAGRRDELLLRTVLGDRRVAGEAWQALRPTFDLQRLEGEWYPLMPLLYTRLRDVAPDQPLLGQLKGLLRHTWVRNQSLLGHLPAILDTLEEVGIPAATMQAVPLALRYYKEPGLRLVPHVEMLVPPGSLAKGAGALRAAGWQPQIDRTEGLEAGTWLVLPPIEPRPTCVLRPQALPGLLPPRPLTAISHAGVVISALGATDELLVTCAGPGRDQPAASLQWIVDATMIVRSAAGSIDWERLVADAARVHVVLRLREAARRLGSASVVLPSAFLVALEQVQVSAREALAHHAAGDGHGSLRRAAASLVRSGDVGGFLRSLLRRARRRLRA
jgi:putative nucleotidyltransferase-like protein